MKGGREGGGRGKGGRGKWRGRGRDCYHDDVGASKIGGFDNGDKVVVCLMGEFIDDSKQHGDGAWQHLSSSNLHQFSDVYSNCS